MRRRRWILSLLFPLCGLSAGQPLPQLAYADAYRPDGAGSGIADYWGVPQQYADDVLVRRAGANTLRITAMSAGTMLGAGFAGDRWSLSFDYSLTHPAPAPAILSFESSERMESYGAPITGLRVLFGRDERAEPAYSLLAVGTMAPYSVVPLIAGITHRIEVRAAGNTATVALDGTRIWAGPAGWGDYPGIYPKWHFAASETGQNISMVPRVRVGFATNEAPDLPSVREAFVARALESQALLGSGRYAESSRTDAWSATALVFEFHRAGDVTIAASLDQWADSIAAGWDGVGSFDGPQGSGSGLRNVGEPGVPLALWAAERGRRDWARVLTEMTRQAGFSGCGADRIGWCRLGNLQPDGTSLQPGEHGAVYVLNQLQMVETAAFVAASVAGAPMEDRRAWIRSLAERTYPSQPNQLVETLGQRRAEGDRRPWWMRARKYHPATIYLLAIAYSSTRNDPVWAEPSVRSLLGHALSLMNTQVVGPLGWREPNEARNFTVGTQELAAAALLRPLVGEPIDAANHAQRWATAWNRLIDPDTLMVRGDESREPDSGLWTALAMTVVGAAGIDSIPECPECREP